MVSTSSSSPTLVTRSKGLAACSSTSCIPRHLVLTFYAPRATRQSDAEYLQRELAEMGESCSDSDVTPTAEELREAIAREVEADGLLSSSIPDVMSFLSTDGPLRTHPFSGVLPAERFSELHGT